MPSYDQTFNISVPQASNQKQNPAADQRGIAGDLLQPMVATSFQANVVAFGALQNIPAVNGTNITLYGVGRTTVSPLERGKVPGAGLIDTAKLIIPVKAMVQQRNVIDRQDMAQDQIPGGLATRIATEQGEAMARLAEEATLIKATQTAMMTDSTFKDAGGFTPEGFKGGTQLTLGAGLATDPEAVYSAILNMIFTVEDKQQISPAAAGFTLWVSPMTYALLLHAENITNTEYWTAAGNSIPSIQIGGVTIVRSPYVPFGKNITASALGTGYTGNFSKVLAVMYGNDAIIRGTTIELRTEVGVQQGTMGLFFIDSWMSYEIAGYRPEHAAVLLLP